MKSPTKLQAEPDESNKPHYRLQLAEQGFVLTYQHIANFSLEANNQ
jgi:hypothetical protein